MSREPPKLSTSHGATTSSGPLIVIVDDEPAILELIDDILEAEGFSVRTAGSGATALKLLEHTPAALIITDLMMPQINGIELARRVRADPTMTTTPIVLMSAAMPAGAGSLFDAVLHKPFAISQLVHLVRRWLPA